jgi:hypothetical protein
MANNVLDNSPGSSNVLERFGQEVVGEIGGIFSTSPVAKYLSGARCILRVNGKIAAFAFAISWNITTDATEVRTIDNYLPYELAPSIIRVSGSISGFRVPGSGPGVLGIQSNILSFLHQRYIEIEVRDSQSDNLIFKTSKALITSRSENVRSDAISEMTLNFTAIGFEDEVKPHLPDGVGEEVDVNGSSPISRIKKSLPVIEIEEKFKFPQIPGF